MRTVLAVVFLAAAGWLTAAQATDCAPALRACQSQCDMTYPSSRDDMGHAGCAARCSLESAACDAQRALDDTKATLDRDIKPWLADQANRWERFMDGFRGRPPEPPRSRELPDRGTAL